jgi:ornithine lipid ester-linked acyl 2-hydroxylase
MSEKKRAIGRFYKPIRRWANEVIINNSLVGDPPVFDPKTFPWTRTLEDNWLAIRDDAMSIWRHWDALPPMVEVVPMTHKITTDDTWRTFFLWCYGERIEQNCARVPQTAALVDRIPGISMALFSYHKPGLHIPRHVGVTKYFLTCHLGLKVPQEREKCRIQVDDQTLLWEEGKTVVFDDMAEHEVWNDTDEYRTILMMQFQRPVNFVGRLIGNALKIAIRRSPVGDEVRHRLDDWDKRLTTAEGGETRAA